MSDEKQKLEISQKEFALIEAALHTQAKILSVQAGAGGAKALSRLNDVKRVLATLAQQGPAQQRTKALRRGFFKVLRPLG